MEREIEGKWTVEDSGKINLERKRESETQGREYLSELFNFACVLRGEIKHIEETKEYIVREWQRK